MLRVGSLFRSRPAEVVAEPAVAAPEARAHVTPLPPPPLPTSRSVRARRVDRCLGFVELAAKIGLGVTTAYLALEIAATVGRGRPGAPLAPRGECGVAPAPTQIRAWRQGGEGNCTTVAVIKAATTLFPELDGERGVFKSARWLANGGLEFETRDGFAGTLTRAERIEARRLSGFVEDEGFAADLYGACVKRVQALGNLGELRKGASFERAAESLNDGEDIWFCLRRLGLHAHAVPVTRAEAAEYEVVVARTRAAGAEFGHAFFVTGGWADLYGEPHPVDSLGPHDAVYPPLSDPFVGYAILPHPVAAPLPFGG